MPALNVMKKLNQPSFARLSPLAKGRIIGLMQTGAERTDITKQVQKKRLAAGVRFPGWRLFADRWQGTNRQLLDNLIDNYLTT